MLRKSGTLIEAAVSWMGKKKKRAGDLVVSNFETIEPKPLPPFTSARLAKLIALTQALELGKGKRVAIYTDSKYAFMVLHAHTAIWNERGHLTTRVSPINLVIKSLVSWRQFFFPLMVQSPIVKDTKKRARKCHEGTKQPIRQLREQHYKSVS